MQTIRRAAAVLIYPAIMCLAVSCDRDGKPLPTASPPAGGPRADVIGQTAPSWVGNLLNENTSLAADPTSTQEELPGFGPKFELFFAMVKAQDPRNMVNDVVSVTTTTAFPAGIGLAVRNLLPGTKIDALTDQLNLKYLFPTSSRTCSGGSPRIQLAIDGDGDGTFAQVTGGPDQNAFGYVGHAAFGVGCITGSWDLIDMANVMDPTMRWDLSQFVQPVTLPPGVTPHAPPACDMTCTWQEVVTYIHATFPNHQVLSGSLVDDSCSFDPLACGLADYDLITVANRTLQNSQDAVP
jgi:hypothetical protein